MTRRTVLFVALLLMAVPGLAAQDSAAVAWETGDLPVARRIYAARVAADSNDQVALHRLALLHAWDEQYAVSLRLFDRLLRAAPGNLDAAVDRARVLAWRGDTRSAVAALDEVLSVRPGHVPALQARAQFLAWAGDFDRSLATYDDLAGVAPDDRAVRQGRALVLSWATRLDSAIALYDSLARSDPGDREARRGLARTLAWAGRLDSSRAVYTALLAADPDDREAARGVARARAWGGDVLGAEHAFRTLVATDTNDVESLVGLAQVLRWQGRDAAALPYLERGRRLEPRNQDVRVQRRWVDAQLQPRVAPTFSYEWDSDGNRITTLAARSAWRPAPRLELRVNAYGRRSTLAAPGGFTQQSGGVTLEAWTQVEPGWALAAGVGGSRSDVTGAAAIASLSASVSSPGRYPFGMTIAASREALDATAPLIRRGVRVTQVGTTGRGLVGGVRVHGSASWARFEGVEANRRLAALLGATRRVARDWHVGVTARAFGFSQDLLEGYFDPPWFGLAEVSLRWEPTWGPWTPYVEGAPGMQQIGQGNPVQTVRRVRAGVRYAAGPGRDAGVEIGDANSGIPLFAPDTGGYWYRWLILRLSWVF